MPAYDKYKQEQNQGLLKIQNKIGSVTMGISIVILFCAPFLGGGLLTLILYGVSIGILFLGVAISEAIERWGIKIISYPESGMAVVNGIIDEEKDMYEEYEFPVDRFIQTKDIPKVVLHNQITTLIENNSERLSEEDEIRAIKQMIPESEYTEEERKKICEEKYGDDK